MGGGLAVTLSTKDNCRCTGFLLRPCAGTLLRAMDPTASMLSTSVSGSMGDRLVMRCVRSLPCETSTSAPGSSFVSG